MISPRTLLSGLHAAAVRGAAPYVHTRDAVACWIDELGDTPPREACTVHLIALGKASWEMTRGACAALAERSIPIAGGVVVSGSLPSPAPFNGPGVLPGTLRLCTGDHPIPGPASLAAAEEIEDAIHDIPPGAFVLVLLSGGTTAMCAAPIAQLSQAVGDSNRAQAYVANFAETLLESGIAIHEMNAIRRRILRFGAGRLAAAIARRGARRIGTFAISDVIGDDPAVIGSGPCSPDPIEHTEFLTLLDAHGLRGIIERPIAVVLGLHGAAPPPEVPSATDPAFSIVDYSIVAGNKDALSAMAQAAREQGIEHVLVDTEPCEGEALELGLVLAARAMRLADELPPDSQALLLGGGEPVVNLRETIGKAVSLGDEDDMARAYHDDAHPSSTPMADEPMLGGRMQVLALAAALDLERAAALGNRNAHRITLLAAGTDGRDGPTDAAGAIVDVAVPALARRAGRIPESDLDTGRSWFSLDAARALLRTGATGTNVMDVVAVHICACEQEDRRGFGWKTGTLQ